MSRSLKIPQSEIRSLYQGEGTGIATDLIMVRGLPVGFLFREPPTGENDSGWRFLAGDETDVDLNDAAEHGVYDLNTIANYDPSIIDLLGAPVGSAFERGAEGAFVEVDFDLTD